ncbi:MAG: SDR family NAD(P)-dependent oxidoreductase [Alphaproteobacteria bacterium]|nr:SDR family NAD(P)-dependent oxidoreductase [Alphaproteobacteria bacterium]
MPGERVAVVTGATGGIGLYTALGLARAGRAVVMVGRGRDRLDDARRFVEERVPGAAVEPLLADFSALAELRRLAEEILSRHNRIDALINNAGLMTPGYCRSADGFELSMAVNHLAPFLLSHLLLDALKRSDSGRIVTVASEAHRRTRLRAGDIAQNRKSGGFAAYCRSKLCNVLFTRELARRLADSTVTASCLHPGLVATAIGDRGGIVVSFGWRAIKPFLIGPEKGAETSVFLATVSDPRPFNGAYVIRKRAVRPDPLALDESVARRVWEESARLVGL